MAPSSSRTRYHHGDLRNAALRAARALLRERGSGAVTVRGVAARVRVTPMALYNHFASRDALLVAVAADGMTELGAAIRSAAPRELDPLDRLERGTGAYVLFAVDNPELFQLMFGGVGAAITEEPELYSAADTAFRTLRDTLSDCARAGVLRADPIAAERALWSAAHGYAALWTSVPDLMRGQRSEIAENAAQMVRAILVGVGRPRRRKK